MSIDATISTQPISATVTASGTVQASVASSTAAVAGVSGGAGPTGSQGPQGNVGPAGPANTLSIGTVTTGAAAASISGTAPSQVLSLVLPVGPQGPAGQQGPQGVAGATGAAGPSGPQGPAGAKGDTGDTGPAGTTTWSGITDKPATFTPSAHTHPASDVTGLSSIATSGSASDLGSGTLAIARIPTGTTSSTVCIGNDSRLSDARTPTAHTQAWSTITSTPTTLAGYGITDAAASSHTHGNISNAGAIGSTADRIAVTTTSGVLTTAAVGSGLSLSGGTLSATGGSSSTPDIHSFLLMGG